jgi:cell division protein FtsB
MIGKVTVTKDIPLGTILHAAVTILGLAVTATMFWMGLSGRLDVLQTKLEAQGEQIQEIKRDVDKLDDRVRDVQQQSSLEEDPFRL